MGAVVEPSRAKKLNFPIYPASPSASWAISVCAPDQAKETAAPLTSCSTNKAQNPGTSGNSGAKAIPAQTKNKVTRRVPKRSIRTPMWIDRNKATIERAPTTKRPSGGRGPPRSAIKKRDEESIEIDIPHAKRPGDIKRRKGSGAGSIHFGKDHPLAGLSEISSLAWCWGACGEVPPAGRAGTTPPAAYLAGIREGVPTALRS